MYTKKPYLPNDIRTVSVDMSNQNLVFKAGYLNYNGNKFHTFMMRDDMYQSLQNLLLTMIEDKNSTPRHIHAFVPQTSTEQVDKKTQLEMAFQAALNKDFKVVTNNYPSKESKVEVVKNKLSQMEKAGLKYSGVSNLTQYLSNELGKGYSTASLLLDNNLRVLVDEYIKNNRCARTVDKANENMLSERDKERTIVVRKKLEEYSNLGLGFRTKSALIERLAEDLGTGYTKNKLFGNPDILKLTEIYVGNNSIADETLNAIIKGWTEEKIIFTSYTAGYKRMEEILGRKIMGNEKVVAVVKKYVDENGGSKLQTQIKKEKTLELFDKLLLQIIDEQKKFKDNTALADYMCYLLNSDLGTAYTRQGLFNDADYKKRLDDFMDMNK